MPPPPKLQVSTALGANRRAAHSKICSAVHDAADLEIVFNSLIFIDSSPYPSVCYVRAVRHVLTCLTIFAGRGPAPDVKAAKRGVVPERSLRWTGPKRKSERRPGGSGARAAGG